MLKILGARHHFLSEAGRQGSPYAQLALESGGELIALRQAGREVVVPVVIPAAHVIAVMVAVVVAVTIPVIVIIAVVLSVPVPLRQGKRR